MLEMLGLDELAPSREKVAILVGPNGSGKSNFLKELALASRSRRHIAVVSNTAYDRFNGVRGIERISASRSGRSPKGVIKRAVALAIDEPDSRFYQISTILEYCGYRPRFGFKVERPDKLPADQLEDGEHLDLHDLETSLAFLERHDPGEIVWIDQNEPVLRFSRAREFAAVLRNEQLLRTTGWLLNVQVYLERKDERVIELLHASSGELALISSLVFLITTIQADPVILIDEPENSLHPNWQREYVDKILTAMSYRSATIVIATHAPLIVTGALAKFPDLVSVFQIQDGRPHLLDLSEVKRSTGGIEEILWRAFDVITPANHFVSEAVVDIVSRFERGEIQKGEALASVNGMDAESFDEQQKRFFGAVRGLLDKVEAQRNARSSTDG